MYRHGPSVLQGPSSRARQAWLPDGAILPMNPDSNSHGDHAACDRSIRTEMVARIRREIADGTYETPEKWNSALDRLLDRLEDK